MTEGPQKENGYTPICNELMDVLVRYRIPGEQRQCLDFIIRKTYGFNKKSDRITNSQFCEATGLKKGNVCRALKELSKKQLVIKSDNTFPPTYEFNKHYSEWAELSKKQPVIKKATIVIKSDNKPLSKVINTKDSKDTLQKTPPYISPRKNKNGITVEDLTKEGIEQELAADLLAHRKAKRAPLTWTAWKGIVREAGVAGWSVSDAVRCLLERGWQTFKAGWIDDQKKSPLSKAGMKTARAAQEWLAEREQQRQNGEAL